MYELRIKFRNIIPQWSFYQFEVYITSCTSDMDQPLLSVNLANSNPLFARRMIMEIRVEIKNLNFTFLNAIGLDQDITMKLDSLMAYKPTSSY